MHFDCIIRGGKIADGSGATEPFAADIGIAAEKIAAIGELDRAQADSIIDVRGQIVCPGFIDVHVHSEFALLGGRDQLTTLRQGVTTHLLAPDGFGWAPLNPERARQFWEYAHFAYGAVDLSFDWPTAESYLEIFKDRIPANVYPQVPHCAVRLDAMGWEPRVATDAEIQLMEEKTREWMEAGAGALCLGLDYQPSANADLRELVALSKITASYGGIYAAHLRYQLLGRTAAWEEIMEISQQAGIPVHVSHERVDDVTGPLLERADRENIDLSLESYLYPAGMTHVVMMLPMDVQVGSPQEVLDRLKNPRTREICLPHLHKNLGTQGNQIVGHTRSGRYIGKTLAEAAASTGKSWEEFAYDLVLEEDGVEAFIFPWQTPVEENEEALRRTAPHPRVMIASDGVYNVQHPHPRGNGCFVRVLRHFVRELELLSLQEAIYKMSGFPAQRFGIKDRGRIATGLAADLVVFDPATVADRSTFEDPTQTAVGVDGVMVNGQWVIQQGAPTDALPGKVLRHSA
jgi:N-acyl-D-amino-acid deacylase